MGTWAPLGKEIAEIGVHETTWPSDPSRSKSVFFNKIRNLDRGVALANYASVFELVGSYALSSELHSIRAYGKFMPDESPVEEFLEILILGEPFLVSIPRYRLVQARLQSGSQLFDTSEILPYLYFSTFAISLSAAKVIAESIRNHGQEQIKFLPMNDGLIKDIQGDGAIALFRDGLALLPPGYIELNKKGRVFQWSRMHGLHPI